MPIVVSEASPVTSAAVGIPGVSLGLSLPARPESHEDPLPELKIESPSEPCVLHARTGVPGLGLLQVHSADSHRRIYPPTEQNSSQCVRSLLAVNELMSRANVPWWLTGGVAVDLYAGRWTRSHGDIDVAVPVSEAKKLWDFFRVDGQVLMRRTMSAQFSESLRVTVYHPAEQKDLNTGRTRSVVLIPSARDNMLPVIDFLFFRSGADYTELTTRQVTYQIPMRPERSPSIADVAGMKVQLFDGRLLAFLKADDHPKSQGDLSALTAALGPTTSSDAVALRKVTPYQSIKS